MHAAMATDDSMWKPRKAVVEKDSAGGLFITQTKKRDQMRSGLK